MKFDIKILEQYKKDGWLMSHTHKELPLIIWNYTQATQYEGKWDEITLNCRGIVTDINGDVIAKGFSKFFNYEEKKTNIPKIIEWTRIYDKVDGSYIQLFNYKGEWLVNSKGSFYSDHVGWAQEILKNKSIENLNTTWTYCFELIHPDNRIVVDYKDKQDLIFLGAFYQGKEVELFNLKGFESAENKLISFNYEELKTLNNQNKEGFVVKFSNGERCKIKFEDYIRLHRIMTDVSSYRVYEALRDKVDLNKWLEGVPDEFFDWIQMVASEILHNYTIVEDAIFLKYGKIVRNTVGFNDKEFALHIQHNKYRAYFFKLRKNRSIDVAIWKEIKPELKYPFKDE